MRYYVSFVDVGFLTAVGAAVMGTRMEDVRPDASALVDWCRDLGAHLPGEVEFLRTYWYDGAFDPEHHEFGRQRAYLDTVSDTPGLTLRLGHIQEHRPPWQRTLRKALKATCRDLHVDFDDFAASLQARFDLRLQRLQKGVDAKIVLDMVRFAQDGVYDTAVLMTGDRDIAEAIRVVQDQGKRVVLAAPRQANVAREIRQLVDQHVELSAADISRMLSARTRSIGTTTG